MAKISISQVLHTRSRMRIFTVMATLVVSAFLFQMMIAQNPSRAEANASCNGFTCTITSSGTLTKLGTDTFSTFRWFGVFLGWRTVQIPDEADLTIFGNSVVVTMSSPPGNPHRFNSLTIDRATVTHTALTRLDDLTMTDNFTGDDIPIDPLKWIQSTIGGVQRIVGNSLAHYLSNAGPAVDLRTEYIDKMTGDFNVEVEYNIANFDTTSANLYDFGLVVTDGTDANYYSIKRQRLTGTGAYNRYRCVRTGDADCGTVGTAETSGKFRINRRGGTIYAYRWIAFNSTWSEIDNWTSVFTTPATIRIQTTNGANHLAFTIRYDNFTMTGTPQNLAATSPKKVDIIVSGALVLNNGGTINVNEKGYPAVDDIAGEHTVSDTGIVHGFGSGGGENHFLGTQNGSIGGGGGYGGHGVYGYNSTVDGGAPYGSSDITSFDFGSAGGYAHSDEAEDAHGGAGGGRIRIRAGSINIVGSTISANGGLGDGATGSGWSGRGSGGSIILEFSGVAGQGLVSDVRGGLLNGANDGAGSVKIINYNFDTTSTAYNIFARGGYTDIDEKGAGGGGRIFLEKIITPNITIKKELQAVSRSNATPADNFNPYALQLSDVIDVVLTISGLTGNIELTDTALDNNLTGSSRVFCSYTSNSIISTTTGCDITGIDPKDGIGISPGTNSICEVRYSCQVTQ